MKHKGGAELELHPFWILAQCRAAVPPVPNVGWPDAENFVSPHRTRKKVPPSTIRVTTRVFSHPLHKAGSCVLSQGRPCQQIGSRTGFTPPTGCLVSILTPPMLNSLNYHQTGWTMAPSGDADPSSLIRPKTSPISHFPLPTGANILIPRKFIFCCPGRHNVINKGTRPGLTRYKW